MGPPRTTAGLETASWITADMAYRRDVLQAVGGFDQRFPRAFREDADLALRFLRSGARLVRGQRRITRPVRPAGPWVSVGMQAGNADDVLMRRLHGPDWRRLADAPPGRGSRHLICTAAGLAALALLAVRNGGPGILTTRRPRPWVTTSAALAAGTWLALTAEFFLARIRPGPRTPAELTRMALTSVAIPPVATWHYGRGLLRRRRAMPWPVVDLDRSAAQR